MPAAAFFLTIKTVYANDSWHFTAFHDKKKTKAVIPTLEPESDQAERQ